MNVASVDGLQVTASRGVTLVADKLIGDCVDETYDLVVLPGGMPGAEQLSDSKWFASAVSLDFSSGPSRY